ncbi:unnamed protein product [Prorocentrum cordatum]|uniref:PH domain-containing protein n=1 Tax=Prorocentrum cordatum TaxID=2364126 RepID=A0ABN9W4Y0_9DINO|nr:unnamed protein product [Polarella glacialis]
MIRFDSEAQARQWQQVLARAAALSAPSAQRIQQLLDDLDTLSASNCSLERSCTSRAVQRAAAGSPPAAPGAPPAAAAPAAAAPRPRSPARLEKLRQSGEARLLGLPPLALESAPAFPEPAGAPPAGSAGG